MKILLDTSFLLPSVGIKVNNHYVPRVLERLSSHLSDITIFYTEINLLEICWVYLKSRKTADAQLDHESLFQLGMESISRGYQRLAIPVKAYLKAIRLKNSGHPDIVDCLLYESSRAVEAFFITLDTPFIKFIKERNLPTKHILEASTFLQSYNTPSNHV